jgi:hypothetical protein
MGYTHYWSASYGDPAYAAAWPAIIGDTRRIIEAVRARGIVIAGPDGYRRPIIDQDRMGVAFNGDATTDLDAESFEIEVPAPSSPAQPQVQFCKTYGKPYDLAVTTVLLRCHLLVPGAFVIRSDGGWDTDWNRNQLNAFGLVAPSARRLVTELFGPVPGASPFTAGAFGWED